MSVFVIGDLHLSLGADKPMDIFKGFENYVERLHSGWQRTVGRDDTVIIAGDVSWAIELSLARPDFSFIHELNGKKWIVKGNHDYWWATVTKLQNFFDENGFNTINILHNRSVFTEDINIAGSRGYIFEGEKRSDKVLNRELCRLRASLADTKPGYPIIAVTHYPFAFADNVWYDGIELLREFNVTHQYYGHIHGAAVRYSLSGNYYGIDMRLVSADSVDFTPVKIK